jgi:hypothetical protein
MLNLGGISLSQRSISFAINPHRSSQSLFNDEKHIITKTKPVPLDNLLPVARQILSKDPSYAVRFDGQLSEKKKKILFNRVELKISLNKYQKMI